jgi:predicted amidohydrolase
VPASVSHCIKLITDAAAAGAELVVLPELCNTGYVYKSKQELTDALSDGDGVQAFIECSSRLGVMLAFGIGRCQGGKLFNSALLVDKGDVLASYDKVHLWDKEKALFTAGDARPPVVDTRLGSIGLAICYDLEFPELMRGLALDGAELIAAPTNWPAGFEPESAFGPFGSELIKSMAAASTNRVFIAIANRTGAERGVEWVNDSSIVDPAGFPVAQLRSGVGFAIANLNLQEARNKRISENNDVFLDRRRDLY